MRFLSSVGKTGLFTGEVVYVAGDKKPVELV